jgi:hypothetical protein
VLLVVVPPQFRLFLVKIVPSIAVIVSRRNVPLARAVMTRVVTVVVAIAVATATVVAIVMVAVSAASAASAAIMAVIVVITAGKRISSHTQQNRASNGCPVLLCVLY